MNWKIIFLLPCFTVLVNAGACNKPSRTYSPEQTGEYSRLENNTEALQPYETIEEWLANLPLQTITVDECHTLAFTPKQNQIDHAKPGLINSRCPSNIVDVLLGTSVQSKRPPELAESLAQNRSNILTSYTFRRIPNVPALLAASAENPSLPGPGILFIFNQLKDLPENVDTD
ncbi:uncharacterized protein LOC126837078 isoform X2 [Adelges cooleyi]|uniref:uncharacterized protein LOC126837078 isoform X2 n=1 Tax=Adelges cooleyi TaxID=133065 RepID=UPI00217FCB79|nr:uncharacterized protein LOC126837078 isoform X2 [Adelges cooleyi]